MEKDWEAIYEAILKDIVDVVETTSPDDQKLERITSILTGNDFMEKTYLI